MGYSLNRIESLGAPFQVVHEQIVDVAPGGSHTVMNTVRKLLFVLSGECRHRVVGCQERWADVHLRPGDILALPHVCEQRYSGMEPGRASSLHVVRLSFDPVCLPPLPLGRSSSLPLPAAEADAAQWADFGLREIRCLHTATALDARGAGGSGDAAAIAETLLHLRKEAERRAPGYRPRVHALCLGLTILFARAGAGAEAGIGVSPDSGGGSRPPTGAGYHAGKIKAYLRGRLHQPTRLAEVAAFVGLSEEHTARLFKATTGLTVLEYGRRLRITQAKSLLAATDNNLSEVARRTGFSSLTVFSRTFRREAGVTPSEFRRQIARQIG